MPHAEPFRLVKWYLDCLDPDGRTAIAYHVVLAWRGLSITWHSVEMQPSTGPVVRRWSLAPCAPPACHDNTVAWPAAALGLNWRAVTAGTTAVIRLYEDEVGFVEWSNVVPAGDTTVALDGLMPLRGAGYVEHLDLTIPPWRLPIHELRWGRWHDSGATRSLVWIDWRGPTARSWVLRDGRLATETEVTDDSVRADGVVLRLSAERTLTQRDVASIVEPIPGLARLLPDALLHLVETKWRGVGTLTDRAGAVVPGQALFELARFGALV